MVVASHTWWKASGEDARYSRLAEDITHRIQGSAYGPRSGLIQRG